MVASLHILSYKTHNDNIVIYATSPAAMTMRVMAIIVFPANSLSKLVVLLTTYTAN